MSKKPKSVIVDVDSTNKVLVSRSKTSSPASKHNDDAKAGKKSAQVHQTQTRNPFEAARNPEASPIPSRTDVMQSYVFSRIETMKKTQALTKRLQQLAAFVPDFVLREDGSRKIPYQSSTDAVVFMVDVSGFTALTEAYSLKGKGGTDQLTKTLFAYISPVAEAILLTDADIVKYAGDAFLAFWRSSPENYEVDVQRAVDCALYIQEKYGSYLCTEVNITIKVKVGIGAGLVHLCGIGNDTYQHYVCFGPGVEAASDAEKHCNSGEVVMSPAAWAHCHPSHYRAVPRDETFRAVSAIYSFIKPDWRGRPLPAPPSKAMSKGDHAAPAPVNADNVRPMLNDSIESRSEEFLRRYLIPPVLRKLDDDIPLDYLNESRQVCICFIHIETVPISHEGIQFREAMIQIVNKAFLKIYSGVTRMQGALTKVIMFDKGLTYLVVFGLPGYVNENQCAHALKFSHATRRALLGMQGVQECSIGVTTGSCYSGVLGHAKRQEYTVMGRKVNKAARLMVYYPGRVSCDQDTASHSKLNPSNFELQEYKELKGIANPGKIYEFVNHENQEDNSVAYFMYPMVGRDTEFRFFKEILTKNKKDLQEHSKATATIKASTMSKETSISKGVWMIVFEGENGLGKSRLLAACMNEAEMQLQVQIFSVAMSLVMTGQSLFAVSSLTMDAIGISGFRTPQEREDYLKKKVQEPDLAAELCVCNDILHTKFPMNPKYANMDANATQAISQHVLATLLKTFYPEELVVFAVDDAHFMDQPSWEFILSLGKTPHIMVLLTMRRTATGAPKIPDAIAYAMYHNKNIKVVRLNGIDTVHCTTLACQMMEAAGIPGDLEKILIAKSQGNPAYIEHVLNALLRTDVIKYSLAYTTNTVFVELRMLDKIENKSKRRSQKAWTAEDDFQQQTDQSSDGVQSIRSGILRHQSSIANVSRMSEMEVDPKKRYLVLIGGTMGHLQIPGTLHENLLDQYDELNSNEQIVLKCASVLGRKFSRTMVTCILPNFEMNKKKYEGAFNHLMDMKYIRCASGIHPKFSKDQSQPPECFCKDITKDPHFNHIGDPYEGGRTSWKRIAGKTLLALHRPKYYSCRFMEFTKEALAEVVYDLMTEDQRKAFHLKAAKYLDAGVALCESCGGQNTAYAYGFVLKSNELMDTEGTLAAVASTKRKQNDKGPLAILELRSRHGGRRTSLQTQITGMKQKFKNDGSRVAQIEFEVLSLLRKIDVKVRRGKCFRRHKSEEEANRELAEELAMFRDAEDDAMVHLKGSTDSGTPQHHRSRDEGSEAGLGVGEGGERGSVVGILRHHHSVSSSTSGEDTVDLRFCECSAVQARVCIEMVKHYREAQKFGKCMINLLEAAESLINVGNGSQALIHLEDATGLLKSMQEGKVQRPEKDDLDDMSIEDAEIEGQVEYLNGLAYFEIGVFAKSKEYFLNALARLGLKLRPESESKVSKKTSLLRAKLKLWTTRYLTSYLRRARSSTSSSEDSIWNRKLKILSYLHTIFKQDKKLELALLVSIWEVVTAERWGDVMHDLIPAYCNMMSTHTAMANHDSSKAYEKLSLSIVREFFSANNGPLDATSLLTTAGLFHAVAYSRLCRGEILLSSEAAYLGLRIGQTIHDNSLLSRLIPTLALTLLMTLRITELVEALQKLWYIAEEEDDPSAMAVYYSLCFDLLLRTSCPLESFVACEQFVISTTEGGTEENTNKDFEIQFALESSMALWHARHSNWEESRKWLNNAESHRPKLSTFASVEAEMKMLETHLLFVSYYLDCKRFQNFAKARSSVKELLRTVTKTSKVAPALKARHLHLMAYYFQIRSKNVEAEKNLKQAEKIATATGNEMELQWILHNRSVWANSASPSVKFFWLENTANQVLDWHTSVGDEIPWSNAMFSLPIPAPKDTP